MMLELKQNGGMWREKTGSTRDDGNVPRFCDVRDGCECLGFFYD
jgi:hypothetical protein